jgi:Protein of unknown function (DUF2806)
MSDTDGLPTIGDLISNWLGVKLPAIAIPLRQTRKNFDKALSKIVLAAGENVEARIKSNTAKTKARGKIDVDGMYRTEDERRKIENRAAATQAAIEDLRQSPPQDDAQAEIDDDWLNYFARLVEDKNSEELQSLFGKLLSGEIKRPGSFSLMTMQSLALISKPDAELLSKLLSFAVGGQIVHLIPMIMGIQPLPNELCWMNLELLGIRARSAEWRSLTPSTQMGRRYCQRRVIVQ